jgi:hypothetical protein
VLNIDPSLSFIDQELSNNGLQLSYFNQCLSDIDLQGPGAGNCGSVSEPSLALQFYRRFSSFIGDFVDLSAIL